MQRIASKRVNRHVEQQDMRPSPRESRRNAGRGRSRHGRWSPRRSRPPRARARCGARSADSGGSAPRHGRAVRRGASATRSRASSMRLGHRLFAEHMAAALKRRRDDAMARRRHDDVEQQIGLGPLRAESSTSAAIATSSRPYSLARPAARGLRRGRRGRRSRTSAISRRLQARPGSSRRSRPDRPQRHRRSPLGRAPWACRAVNVYETRRARYLSRWRADAPYEAPREGGDRVDPEFAILRAISNMSIGTVSRALNDKADVNPVTRQRVREAAARARLFAEPVGPQPAARPDRPRRRHRPRPPTIA